MKPRSVIVPDPMARVVLCELIDDGKGMTAQSCKQKALRIGSTTLSIDYIRDVFSSWNVDGDGMVDCFCASVDHNCSRCRVLVHPHSSIHCFQRFGIDGMAENLSLTQKCCSATLAAAP
jgi:hypothetical protein